MACDAQTLLNAAATNGYFSLDDRTLKMAILYMLCNGGAGGGGQILTYDVDPLIEGVVPTTTSSPAIVYQKNGTSGMFVWDVDNQTWV